MLRKVKEAFILIPPEVDSNLKAITKEMIPLWKSHLTPLTLLHSFISPYVSSIPSPIGMTAASNPFQPLD